MKPLRWLACLLSSALWVGNVAAEDLEPYSGLGTVYIVNNATVALEYDPNSSRDPEGLLPYENSEHHLVSDGTTSYLINGDPPFDPESDIPLNGDGRALAASFSGNLYLSEVDDEVWKVEVWTGSTLVFTYQFHSDGSSATPGQITIHCPNGSATCTPPPLGACICWCGPITGNPYCIVVRILLTVTTL